MSTPQSQPIEQLLFRVQRIKHRRGPSGSKIAEMEQLIESYAARPPEQVASIRADRKVGVRRRLSAPPLLPSLDGVSYSMVAPPPPTYATPFAQILSYLNLTTRSFFRTAEALSSFLQHSS